MTYATYANKYANGRCDTEMIVDTISISACPGYQNICDK